MIFTLNKIHNEILSKAIDKYIKDGYKLLVDLDDSFTPSVKLALAKPKDNSIIKIYFGREVESSDKLNRRYNVYKLNIIKCVLKDRYNFLRYINDGFRNLNLFFNACDLVESHKFYEISNKGNCLSGLVFTDSFDEFVDIFNKRVTRYGYKYYKQLLDSKPYTQVKVKLEDLSPKFVDHLMERVNNIRGFKNANATCIKSVYVQSTYVRDSSNRRHLIIDINNGKQSKTLHLQ